MSDSVFVPCDYCEGKGACPICKGSGQTWGPSTCSNCAGDGRCYKCKGARGSFRKAPAPRASQQAPVSRGYDDDLPPLGSGLFKASTWRGIAVAVVWLIWIGIPGTISDAIGTWLVFIPFILGMAFLPVFVRIPASLRSPEVWIKAVLAGVFTLNIFSIVWLLFTYKGDIAGVSYEARRAARTSG